MLHASDSNFVTTIVWQTALRKPSVLTHGPYMQSSDSDSVLTLWTQPRLPAIASIAIVYRSMRTRLSTSIQLLTLL